MPQKKNWFNLLLVLALLGMMLTACVPAAQTVEPTEEATEEPTEEATEESTEEPTEEATEEPTEEPMADPGEMLDANVTDFLVDMEGYNFVSPAEVNEMMVEMDDLFLLDVRNPSELEESGYIEGAVNIPLRELAQHVDQLPADDTPIVVYCAAGTRATLGMGALAAMGYSDVKTMAGGSFGGWVEEGYPIVEGELPEPEILDVAEIDPAVLAAVDAYLAGLPEGFAQLPVEGLNEEIVDGEELVIVDVRRPEELEENGIIEGAVSIPLEQFIEMKDMWPAEDANIVVYCRAGYRGNFAAAVMRTYGYENVRNLKGGFTAWTEAGFPVVTE
jgi:rhodanese-related sulfurtransferase